MAAVIGAGIGLASYTIGLAVTGNLHQWNIGGTLKATFWGAVSGAVSFGLGELFSAAKVVKALGEAKFLVQAAAHGVSQGVLSVMQGGDFLSGAAGGFFGSLGSSAFGAIAGNFANSAVGTIAFGALSGGIGAELSGGNFWQGAVTGGIVAGLNHTLHRAGNGEDPNNKYLKMRKRYRQKLGGRVKINANSIDWSNADLTEPGNRKGTYRIRLSGRHFANLDDALIHGTVSIEAVPQKKGYYRVVMDDKLGCRCGVFDFEQHTWESPLSGRNISTFIGGVLTGGEFHILPESQGISISIIDKGKPFMIEYNGIFKLR